MKSVHIIVAATAVVAMVGCSFPPAPVSPPTGGASGSAASTARTISHESMLPKSKSADLLYVSNSNSDGLVLIFAYPKGTLLGQVTVPSGIPQGLCSDAAGNVFVVTYSGSPNQSNIYEYAHGGTEPVATLSDPGAPQGCAVDPTTGNLAVTNSFTASFGPGNVAIYADGQGVPSIYSDSSIPEFLFCTYDSTGDLFADGSGRLSMLSKGGQNLEDINLNQNIAPSSIQWGSKYQALIVSDGDSSQFGPYNVYQIRISGSMGSVTGPTTLKTRRNRSSPNVQFWTGNGRIIGAANVGSKPSLLDFWRYPKGGRPMKTINRPGGATDLFGVTVSRAYTSMVPGRRVAGIVVSEPNPQ